MTFDYEHQMVMPAEQWLALQGLATKREFSTPWGICDLVGCSFRKASVKKRLALGQTKPIGPQIRVMILSQIPDQEENKSITLRGLQRKFTGFLDELTVGVEVDRLITDKFVQITPRGNLQKLNGWVPLHKKLVTLELKLTRVNDALRQAICHLEFSDESYVGVPMKTALRLMRSRKKAEFVREGIGVLGVGGRKCKVFLKSKPVNSNRNQVIQMHCVERFWRTHPKGN